MAKTLYDALVAISSSGNYSVETEYATTPVELLVIENDTTYSANTNLGNTTPDMYMLGVHYKGNLTINSGVTVTAAARKRGMIIIVDGDCNINGTLTMTNRGANTSVATYPSLSDSERTQRILILQNNDVDLEIPAFGGLGALGKVGVGIGLIGSNGVDGGTGGGGSGGCKIYDSGTPTSGTGAQGTSFSGGAGSGATFTYETPATGNAGTLYGGKGSDAYQDGGGGGGGAGNPTGIRNKLGLNGTGGLLILIVLGSLNIGSTGIVSANGCKGGGSDRDRYSEPGGGGSGGGSVNIFSVGIFTNAGTVQALGGQGNGDDNVNYAGGSGGAGSIRVMQISPPSATAIKRRFAQII